jgi:type III restriction enzyme
MKIQFESNLSYQDKAISSIVDIFEGQEICQSNFSIVRQQTKGQKTSSDYDDLGIGNRLELLDDEILSNIQNIQLYYPKKNKQLFVKFNSQKSKIKQ